MAETIDMGPFMQKAELIQKMMAEAAKESDPDKMKEWADRLSAEGRELERLGHELEQKTRTLRGIARVTVVLTPDQKKRILEKTGIAMETLVMDDEAGAMGMAMPITRQEEIEKLAMDEAERRRIQAEAEKKTRAAAEQALADIEATGMSEALEQVAQLRRDPNFLGGVLHKK
jgi:hypothetical protein